MSDLTPGVFSLRRRPGRALVGLAALGTLAAACERSARVEGAALGAPAPLASPAGEGSAEPNLAVGPEGEVYLSWIEPAADSAHELRLATLTEDGWSRPRTIARGSNWFVNWADFPAVQVLPGGRIAASYLERHPEAKRGYDYGVRIVQSTDGGATWSAPVTPHRDGVPAEHGFVSLFPAGGDSLGVVWLDGRKTHPSFGGVQETTLRYTALAPDGSLGPEVLLDERNCDCCQTAVARTARGPVAVYRDRTADEVRDIYVTRLVDGRWTEGAPVHRDGWEIAACPVNGPAISARGEAVAVAWFTGARDTARVYLAFSDDAGATFGPPVRVDGGDPAGRVDVELLDDGSALVSWLERTGQSSAEVRARVMGRQGEAGTPVTIASSSGERASGFPRMARSGDQVIFAWTEPGSPSTVRTARLAVGGAS